MTAAPTPLVLSYLDPDGKSWNLSDRSLSSGVVCSALTGIEGLPIMMQTIPMLDGTAIPNIYIPQPGSPVIALYVTRPASDSENDYYALLDSVVRAWYHRRNELPAPGYLQVQRPNGNTRQVAVYTISGLNSPEVGINNGSLFTLTLQTPDPYWTDLVPQTINFGLNYANGILPLLPVWLSGATVLGTSIINNPGNAQTFPTWTITGPGTPTITNNTSNLSWSLNAPIPAGQVVQVTTKPGTQMAVNLSTSTNIWDSLVLSSLRSLWPLRAGNNSISLAMAGASAATQVSLSWTNRWNRA